MRIEHIHAVIKRLNAQSEALEASRANLWEESRTSVREYGAIYFNQPTPSQRAASDKLQKVYSDIKKLNRRISRAKRTLAFLELQIPAPKTPADMSTSDLQTLVSYKTHGGYYRIASQECMWCKIYFHDSRGKMTLMGNVCIGSYGGDGIKAGANPRFKEQCDEDIRRHALSVLSAAA